MNAILIEANELVSLIDKQDVIVVDTRSPEEYAKSHIPDAVNIHEIFTYLSASTPQGIKAMRQKFTDALGNAGISNNSTVIFYEEDMDKGFGQSCRGYFLLSYLGHKQSHVLHGGLAAWKAEGYETNDTTPDISQKKLVADDSGLPLIVGKEEVFNELGKDRVTLLDVRDVDEWIAESSSPYGKDFSPRKGRIPGAKWLEWYRMMKASDKGKRIKSAEEVKAECRNIGLDFDKPIWLYCFKGSRTSNTYVALKQAGFENVSTYFGSWNEWAQDLDMPIEEGLPES
ncbi:sulfurtransferase [Alteromonadaceae bacterium M269]|nr:sulfurtransferase [Alteromonadaceae bacterium M269]